MDINKLKRKREGLKFKIREWKKKGKNASDLVDEYHKILAELNKLGVKTETRADYLKKEYWVGYNGEDKPVIKEEKIKPTQDSFILCLAWVDEYKDKIPEQVIKVKKYFEELGLPILNEDSSKIDERIEHVLKYEFIGSEESFRLLKTCTQFVLDSFAKSDFERFNIAIYGKKKNF